MYRSNLLSHSSLLVIVNDLDIERIALSPNEADPPLIVDPNAMLPFPITFENLKSIPGWHFQIREIYTPVYHSQFPESRPLNVIGQLPCWIPVEQLLGLLALEALYHNPNL